MWSRRRDGVAAVALVALVVLAGCGSVLSPGGTPTSVESPGDPTVSPSPTDSPSPTETATQTPTPTPTPKQDGPVSVRGGSLPVDEDRVWYRVQDIMAANVSPPGLTVLSLEGLGNRTRNFARPRFLHALGLGPPEDPVAELNRSLGALTYRSGRVEVHLGENATAGAVECLLAHEFAHVVALRQRFPRRMAENWSDESFRPYDGTYAFRSVREGVAMLVQRTYAERYGCQGASPYADWVGNGTAWEELVGAPYHYGEAYVSARVDSPADLSALAADPPRTTEQVLHPGQDHEMAPLSITVSDGTAEWQRRGKLRMGELVTRSALSGSHSDERAARAAAGWGNDTLLWFSDVDEDGWVWVTRWDDAANATEFERAFAGHLDARGESVGDGHWVDAEGRHWRVVRTGDRTVVVVGGPERFLDTVAVSGGTNVTVTVGNRTAV